MKTNLFLTFCLLAFSAGWSQTVEYYDAEWKSVAVKEGADYFRKITYNEHGQPVGTVKDYYITGELLFEGKMVSVNPNAYEGKCTWYHQNGEKRKEAFYQNGRALSTVRIWSEEGKEEGVISKDGYFFSEDYALNIFNQVGVPFGLKFDTTSIDELLNIGKALIREKIYKESLKLFQLAHDISWKEKKENKLAKCYEELAYFYRITGDFQQALKWYGQAIEIEERLDQKTSLSISFSNMGGIHDLLGNFDLALSFYEAGRDIQERLALINLLPGTYSNIGIIYRKKGKPEKALDFYNKARELVEQSNMDDKLATIYNNMGVAYRNIGNLDAALKWYQKAREISLKLNAKLSLAMSCNNIATLHGFRKDYLEALAWHKKALDLFEDLENETWFYSLTLGQIGHVFYHLGKTDEALKWQKKAMELQENYGYRAELSKTYNNLGDIFFSKKNYSLALIFHHKAKDIQEKLGFESTLPRSYRAIAENLQLSGELSRAILWYKEAIKTAKRLGLEIELSRAYLKMSSIYYHDYNRLDSALYYAIKNIEINDRLRSTNKLEDHRQSFVNESLDALEIALECAFLMEDFEMAFTLSEKERAGKLSDLIVQGANDSKKIPSWLRRRYESVESQLISINQYLNRNLNVKVRKDLIRERDSLYQLLRDVTEQGRINAPNFMSLVYPKTANSKQIQDVLNRDEVLISFSINGADVFALIIAQETKKSLKLGSSAEISKLVDRFRQEFIEQQKIVLLKDDRLKQINLDEKFFQISQNIYQAIWAKLDSTGLLEHKKIILVPDGYLNYLPFEIIIKDKTQKEYSEYQYLIREYGISYYPSATSFHYYRVDSSNQRKPPLDFFGVANSKFENANCTNTGRFFGDLSNQTLHINAIQSLFPKERSAVLIDESANEGNLKKAALSDYRYLHFSTHGIINSEMPEFSSILLQSGEFEDGCLNLYEIFDLQLNADLVTLSACETALGKLVKGEGMVGFTHALMHAGSSSLILSLWEVEDLSTNQLFFNYYEELTSEGAEDKIVPLRATKLKMIGSINSYSNPDFWAPFVFIGERYSKI